MRRRVLAGLLVLLSATCVSLILTQPTRIACEPLSPREASDIRGGYYCWEEGMQDCPMVGWSCEIAVCSGPGACPADDGEYAVLEEYRKAKATIDPMSKQETLNLANVFCAERWFCETDCVLTMATWTCEKSEFLDAKIDEVTPTKPDPDSALCVE